MSDILFDFFEKNAKKRMFANIAKPFWNISTAIEGKKTLLNGLKSFSSKCSDINDKLEELDKYCADVVKKKEIPDQTYFYGFDDIITDLFVAQSIIDKFEASILPQMKDWKAEVIDTKKKVDQVFKEYKNAKEQWKK